MFILRKTFDAAVEEQRQIGASAVMQLAKSYGEALRQVTALQTQLSAWVLNKADNITPKQAAQLFYAQHDGWQAEFFNCMQDVVQAIHDARPPASPGYMPNPHPGVPAGEGQWYHMAKLLNDSGFETIEAMFGHAQYHRGKHDEDWSKLVQAESA